MAVMASWSFTDNGMTQEFMQLVNGLKAGPLALQPSTAPETDAEQEAAASMAMGYSALNHTTRQGERAVSWYRGPLVPLPVQPESLSTWPVSDAALRFDPARAMLDVSYAAAWQLGRLLVLSDTEVAQALFEWRRQNQMTLSRLAARIGLARVLPSLGLAPDRESLLAPRPAVARLAGFLGEQLGPTLLGENGAGPADELGPPADPSGLRRLREEMPGLLSEDELDELMAGEDAAPAIARRIVEGTE
jgi:hypothetical protein